MTQMPRNTTEQLYILAIDAAGTLLNETNFYISQKENAKMVKLNENRKIILNRKNHWSFIQNLVILNTCHFRIQI